MLVLLVQHLSTARLCNTKINASIATNVCFQGMVWYVQYKQSSHSVIPSKGRRELQNIPSTASIHVTLILW